MKILKIGNVAKVHRLTQNELKQSDMKSTPQMQFMEPWSEIFKCRSTISHFQDIALFRTVPLTPSMLKFQSDTIFLKYAMENNSLYSTATRECVVKKIIYRPDDILIPPDDIPC